MANKGGRPTKYEGVKMVQMIDKITNEMDLKHFFSFCGIEHIADALGVCKDTVYRWKKQHRMFSDAIKDWETKRNMLFYSLSMTMAPAVWIFLAKNWLKMTDKQIQQFQGSLDIKPMGWDVVHINKKGQTIKTEKKITIPGK